MRLRLLLTMALTVVSLTVGSTAQAAPPRPEATQADTAAIARADLASELRQARALEPYFDARTTTFDAPAALAAGIDATVVADFQTGLHRGNAHRAEAAEKARCAGLTQYKRKIAYVEIWVNTCDVKFIVGSIGISGGAIALAGVILAATGIGAPVGIIVGIAGALIAIGSGALNACDRYSRGVVLDNLGWPCRSQ